MRPHEKNIDMVPDTWEVLSMIDAHKELKKIEAIRTDISWILAHM